MAESKSAWVVTRTARSDDSLSHHGIAGQKWGEQNGPPYPLDYNDHSSLEKRGRYQFYIDKDKPRKDKPLKNMTGSKRQDYKKVKEAYEQARYATAAQKQIHKEREKAEKKAENSKNLKAKEEAKKMAELDSLAKKEASKRQKKLESLGSEFSSLYGSKKIKDLNSESLANMSDSKSKKYVYRHGKETVAAFMLGGDVLGTSILKRSRNKSQFESYKSALAGDEVGEKKSRNKATVKNLALQGYTGYKITQTNQERRRRAKGN